MKGRYAAAGILNNGKQHHISFGAPEPVLASV